MSGRMGWDLYVYRSHPIRPDIGIIQKDVSAFLPNIQKLYRVFFSLVLP